MYWGWGFLKSWLATSACGRPRPSLSPFPLLQDVDDLFFAVSCSFAGHLIIFFLDSMSDSHTRLGSVFRGTDHLGIRLPRSTDPYLSVDESLKAHYMQAHGL